MSVVSRATLKSYFLTGDVPTQAQYADLIDSMLSLAEDSTINDGVTLLSANGGGEDFLKFGDGSGGSIIQMQVQGSAVALESDGSVSMAAATGAQIYIAGDQGVNISDNVFISLDSPENDIDGGDTILSNDIVLTGSGKGMKITQGANCRMTAPVALVAGSKVINNTTVTANTVVIPVCLTPGGTPGFLRCSARTAGTSFTITSGNSSDTSTIVCILFEPA